MYMLSQRFFKPDKKDEIRVKSTLMNIKYNKGNVKMERKKNSPVSIEYHFFISIIKSLELLVV